jgi:uncharacterized membrane protein YhiD involved in acid resistance
MEQIQSFEQFLANQVPSVSPSGFFLNLILTAILAKMLGLLYARHGNSLSNRKIFASNFELIAVTTMIIITIVKSSLALSLGLVGALSIVRFRAAIKEPQELAFIFLAIAIGLGFGADQRLITFFGFVFAAAVIWIRNYWSDAESSNDLNLTILAQNPSGDLSLDRIVETISQYCKELELKRIDETNEQLEVSFLAVFKDLNGLNKARAALHNLDEAIQISYMDHT